MNPPTKKTKALQFSRILKSIRNRWPILLKTGAPCRFKDDAEDANMMWRQMKPQNARWCRLKILRCRVQPE